MHLQTRYDCVGRKRTSQVSMLGLDSVTCILQVLEGWYKNAEAADKKGLVLFVTAGKEGAVTGGKGFIKVGASQALCGLSLPQ